MRQTMGFEKTEELQDYPIGRGLLYQGAVLRPERDILGHSGHGCKGVFMQTVAGVEGVQRPHSIRYRRSIWEECSVSCIYKYGSYPQTVRHRVTLLFS